MIAGTLATVSVVVLSLFLIPSALAVVLAVIELVLGLFPLTPSTAGGIFIAAVVVVLWARLVIGDFLSVSAVEVADDGSWTLKGPFGRTRGVVSPGTPITVTKQTRDTWMFGVARRYTQVWATIEADGRSWVTSRGPIESAGPIVQRLIERAR